MSLPLTPRDLVESARALWQAELWKMVSLRGLREALPVILRGQLGPATVFRIHAAAFPDRPALIEEGRFRSWSELNRRACRLANFLSGRGVGAGSRVALVLRNSAAFIETQAACSKLRAATVPLSYRLTAAELAYVFGDCSPAAVVFHADLADSVLAADPARAGATTLVAVGGEAPGTIPFEEAVAAGREEEPPEPEAEPSLVLYTSGTTGRPKGAVRSFKSGSFAQLVSLLRRIPLRHTDVHLVATPLYHALASGFSAVHLGLGATLVLLERFDPEGFLAAVERYRVTTTALVPTLLRELVELPPEVRRRRDWSSLRVIVMGGAALEHGLVRRFAEAYRPDLLYNLYGATEFGWVTVAGPRELLERPDTIGRAVAGCDIALLDGDRREVPPGEVGELYVKSDLLIDGYHRDPDATSASLHEGYFTVGDLARRDADGYYYLAGRKVDMVISGGVNIYPAEIEAALARHPGVAEAAVIGVPDERWGESLRAFVVPKDGAALDPEEIQAFLRTRLAGYKVPRQYRFVDALPKNPTGKVLKRELRALA